MYIAPISHETFTMARYFASFLAGLVGGMLQGDVFLGDVKASGEKCVHHITRVGFKEEFVPVDSREVLFQAIPVCVVTEEV